MKNMKKNIYFITLFQVKYYFWLIHDIYNVLIFQRKTFIKFEINLIYKNKITLQKMLNI